MAGSIRKLEGKGGQDRCDEYIRAHGKVKTGSIAVTKSINLKCDIIIHAVGKFGPNRQALLASVKKQQSRG